MSLHHGRAVHLAEIKPALLTYTKKHDLVSRVDQQYLNVNADAASYAAQCGSPTSKAPPVPKFT